MTAFDFRKTMQVQLELYGNAYANIVYDRAGRVKELWPIPSPYVKVVRTDAGELVGYEIAVPGDGVKRVAPQEMFHLRGLGDGYVGFKPLQYAREIIGLALATEQYGAEFFANGAVASGIVEIPGRLSPEALEKFKADFRQKYEGLGRQHRILFLEQGLKFHQMTIQNDNAQFLETRKYQVEEVARFFGVPPHKVGALDRATFSNIEHQAMEFVQDCIRPRVVNWEQQVRRQLFREADKGKYFAEFILGGLLRGDAKTRAEYYRVGRNDGWLSANDIRELENMNPIPAEQGGDDYLINGNMVPIRAILQEKGGQADA
jgi:HK97 family phage portal protein